jgi:signal transduction histidine kinase
MGNLAIAQVVHDLRNQLAVMIACSQGISRLVPDGVAAADVLELRRSAERASMLTRELLLAVRRARETVDLNDVVGAAVATVSRLTGTRIRLQLRLWDEPLPVVAEPLELERIVLNLAMNARDAMVTGGALTIETALVAPPGDQAAETGQGPWARLSVTDTGCGMTDDVQARMFEPFFTTKPSGTGLGLSSVAFTLLQLGGTIAASTEPGRGTCVEIRLPMWTHA